MEQKIKELRLKIDGLAQLTKALQKVFVEQGTQDSGFLKCLDCGEIFLYSDTCPNEHDKKNTEVVQVAYGFTTHSSQIMKATDSLFLAKAWLGKILGSLGIESPYPKDGSRKTVADIEPTADRADLSYYCIEPLDYEHKSHVEKVDWLRQEISRAVKELVNLEIGKFNVTFGLNREIAIARTKSYTHLSEARFWLGFELERVREEGIK